MRCVSSAAAVARRSFCLLLMAWLQTGRVLADDADQFFESEIRPLLIEKCIGCHGLQKQSGGLRLDSRDAILKGGESGVAMTPGDAAGSRIVQAIRYDGDLQMPPKMPLSETQQQALTRWIELGAPWPNASKRLIAAAADAASSHWAFQPAQQPDVPSVDSVGVPTPVDAFIIENLHEAGLEMSAEADRRTLIRRVSYSLTGLPSSPEAVDEFVHDRDPQSYEKLVDRLLASPAHGEQWARHWLDVARYSDTKGYVYAREERFWVHAWSYRDWVVKALNSDMPYDRFLLLQLAADQVADRSDEDLAAMGLLTLGRRFQGVRRDIIDDRIDVVCRGTMALTVGCARCHDHKYDPIPTADYYSLYGVFDSCRERIVPLSNTVADEAFAKDLSTRTAALEKLRQERRESTSARVRARLGDYLQAQRELQKYPEEGFDQILETGDLLPAFVHRWRDRLRDADRRGDPVFVAWHRFAALPESEFASRAAEVTQGLHEMSSEQINARIAAAFATPSASFDEVVKRYAQVFAEVDQLWQADIGKAKTDGTELPERLMDDADEQLRRLLYGPGSLCEVPDEPVVHIEYDVDSAACNELWKLQGEVDQIGRASCRERVWRYV